jgi:hypothetical protein
MTVLSCAGDAKQLGNIGWLKAAESACLSGAAHAGAALKNCAARKQRREQQQRTAPPYLTEKVQVTCTCASPRPQGSPAPPVGLPCLGPLGGPPLELCVSPGLCVYGRLQG